MNISIIAAMTENKIIGFNNCLPWKIAAELQYFKKITLNKPIIMGWNTFGSINNKALPNRCNIVLTRDLKKFKDHMVYDNLIFATTIEDSLRYAGKFYNNKNIDSSCSAEQEIMIIGGREIYKQFLPLANKLYLSIIKNNYTGDVFFPEYDVNCWKLVNREEYSEFVSEIWVQNI